MYVTLAIPISPCRGLVLSTITGVDCFDVHQCPQSDCDCPLQSHPEFSRIRSATPIMKHALSLSLSLSLSVPYQRDSHPQINQLFTGSLPPMITVSSLVGRNGQHRKPHSVRSRTPANPFRKPTESAPRARRVLQHTTPPRRRLAPPSRCGGARAGPRPGSGICHAEPRTEKRAPAVMTMTPQDPTPPPPVISLRWTVPVIRHGKHVCVAPPIRRDGWGALRTNRVAHESRMATIMTRRRRSNLWLWAAATRKQVQGASVSPPPTGARVPS
jgi:hypothetical protein